MSPDDPPGRTPPPPGKPASDEAIPMLTEIVQVPRYTSDELPETPAEVDWSRLAERVRENVTERLMQRSQSLLDSQLRSALDEVVERTTATLAAELHEALTRMVRDAVARAVSEELGRVHAEIARRKS